MKGQRGEMAEEEMTKGAQKIAESVLLLAIARVSMALSLPVIGLISWLGSGYLEGKFDAVNVRVTAVEQKAEVTGEQAAKINDRLIAVETGQTAALSAREKFEAATLARLDRLQDSIVSLSNAVAALTATVQADRKERSSQPQ
ncbi:MAG: hypothetical protein E5X38_07475 [Mesorhizobium sp.]|uniref:hypothetical protein n=1 Tax=unclassified Mesorhizobium TaxID=325217 RepID=UPI000FCACBFD|nr:MULTISPECIES: hypothetical protein [unclassified Mesorhizobium]RUV20372.1 hypothetical protein EOA91_16230 [Mesorhizobium sp. M1A.F.Ca.IN.022.04.1.1]RUV63469.1 hypothetical protein EOA64_08650 [Mesorhizobium sp. M1A.F.Ca.IN.022.02.1.1]RWH27041.1 MAG: hypothetical protein EOQ75_03910 [Mesorhizobium sp.]TIM36046.1 MAG: hypothetical protein E5Y45_00225 [Mesorhizobium sp.]TIQ88693.1 MAG: hypothetical protein E5X38_07475 [Mesorhizobium sp.]